MEKFINKHKNLFIILLVSIAMILFVVFYFLLLDDDNYNYKHIKGNSYTANDNSYLVLNNDKTFYWYKDKNDKSNYYYGSYTVKRGENAVKFISSDLAVYDITEEAQRQTIENIDNGDIVKKNIVNILCFPKEAIEKLSNAVKH